MSKHKANVTTEEGHSVSVKLTKSEFDMLLRDAHAARRQPGPQAAWIVAEYLAGRLVPNG